MLGPDDYTVGWICAIRTELVAATAFLDEKHADLEDSPANDNNAYVLGRIGKHNVVVAALPQGEYGLVNAASVARDLLRSFPNVRVGLMVGIGGGAPSQKHDIRLGDVVVGTPGNGRGGVLQYDYGKMIQGKDFKLTGHLNQPPQGLLTALTTLGAQYESDGHDIQAQIDGLLDKKPRLRANYQKPNSSLDCLFISSFEHAGNDTDQCATTCNDKSNSVTRLERSPEQDSPMIHYGLIASANQLMKDAHIRDELSARENVLCFEMEAAGLVNNFPCLVIRGICDYSDTHKNKIWQGYAAMAAAAFAKDLLLKIAPRKVAAERRLSEILSNMDTKLSVISDSLFQSQKSLETRIIEKGAKQVVRWLAAAEVSSNQNRAIETRHTGSGQKLLRGEAYMNWKKNSSSFLWLNGIPGSGKTILASTVIEDLQSSPDCSRGLLYYYFDFTDTRKQNFETALRSLLAQFYLRSEGTKAEMDSLYTSCKNGEEQPGMSLLKSTFLAMIEQAGGTWIVIDALDECRLRHDLLEWLRDLRTEQIDAHILVTSRPEQDIQSAMDRVRGHEESITVQDGLLEDDIGRYIQARVREHEAFERWRERPDIRELIEKKLVKKAKGMFRWVACQLDALEKCHEPITLRATLKSLPRTLDETYARILAQIPPEHMRNATRLLQFLAYSERSLRVDEAVDIIAVCTGPDMPRGSRFDPTNRMPIPAEITTYCSSLVVLVQRELRRADSRPKVIVEEIQLAHSSVKDYFKSDRLENEATQYLNETSARTLMAEVCLAYMLELDPNMAAFQQKKLFPFSEYSANHWAICAVFGEKNSQTVRQLAVEFLQNPISVALCRQLETHFWESPFADTVNELYYASFIGLPRCVGMLLERSADIYVHNGSYGEALVAASKRGHVEVVQLLMEQGAENCIDSGHHGFSLRAAIARKHSQIVLILRGKMNCPYAQDKPELRINLEDVDNEGSRLLREAATTGDVGLTDLLLDMGVELEKRYEGSDDEPTLFHLAAEQGQIKVLEMLLSRGVNCFTVDGSGWTPLISAAWREQTHVVKLLLDLGANPSFANYSGWTSLYAAAHRGYVEIVDLLLQYGADWSIKDREGWTPLCIAAFEGHVEVVSSLLEAGADWSAVVHHGGSVIHHAASGGQSTVVQMLLDAGADAMAQDSVGRSILFFAIISKSQDLFNMLLNQFPLLVGLKDHYGSTALSVASRCGMADMVKAIASLPEIDLISGDKFGRTALWWAYTQKHDDIANYLIDSAEHRGIPLVNLDLPLESSETFTGLHPVFYACDVCLRHLNHFYTYYRCPLCCRDGFRICLGCARLEARCLDESHNLTLYDPDESIQISISCLRRRNSNKRIRPTFPDGR